MISLIKTFQIFQLFDVFWMKYGFCFPYIENNHPNWRTPSFFRGVGQPLSTTNQYIIIIITVINHHH